MDFKRHGACLLVSALLLLVAVLHAIGVAPLAPVRQLDLALYDWRLRATLPGTLDERIVIVDIDEKSLAELGRWPWPRDRIAGLVDELFDRQRVALIGFDVVFAEPDTSSGLATLEALARGELRGLAGLPAALERLRPQLDHDARLARALADRPVVLGYYFNGTPGAVGELPEPVLARADLAGRPVRATRWLGHGANLPVLAQAAPRAGFFNALQDGDGVVRTVPMLAEYQGQYYESLPLAMFRGLLGDPEVSPGFPQERWLPRHYQGLDSLVLGSGPARSSVPVDDRLAALVPYRGPGGPQGGSYRYVSATDLVHGRVPAAELQGRLVIVGTTAPGMFDLRTTPVGEVYPGVEAHANLLSGLMDGRLPVRPDYALGYDVLLLVLLGAGVALALPRLSPRAGVALAVAVIAAVALLNFWLHARHQLVMPLAAQVLLVGALLAAQALCGLAVQARPRRRLAQRYGPGVAPAVLDALAQDGAAAGEAALPALRPVSVLAFEASGPAGADEAVAAAQARRDALQARVAGIVHAHGGSLDLAHGGGGRVLAFWGAPLPVPDGAARAARAALEVAEAVAAQGAPADGGAACAIGLHRGEALAGLRGGGVLRQYGLEGAAVATAWRLAELARSYGVPALASDALRDEARGQAWQEVDRVHFREPAAAGHGPGTADAARRPLSLYQPLAQTPAPGSPEAVELASWQQALKAYRQADWEQAELHLLNLRRLRPGHRLYELFAYRVAHLRQHPPPAGWDGAFQAD